QEQALEVSRLEGLSGDVKRRLASSDERSGLDASVPVQTTSAQETMIADLTKREEQIRNDELEFQNRIADLERLSGELADQRLYLAEECKRLGQARLRWGNEHEQAAVELEALAVRLQRQEQEHQAREHALAKNEIDWRQRRE